MILRVTFECYTCFIMFYRPVVTRQRSYWSRRRRVSETRPSFPTRTNRQRRKRKRTKPGKTLSSLRHYHRIQRLREGHIISHVCLFMGMGVGAGCKGGIILGESESDVAWNELLVYCAVYLYWRESDFAWKLGCNPFWSEVALIFRFSFRSNVIAALCIMG